jgi:hypothetical protein
MFSFTAVLYLIALMPLLSIASVDTLSQSRMRISIQMLKREFSRTAQCCCRPTTCFSSTSHETGRNSSGSREGNGNGSKSSSFQNAANIDFQYVSITTTQATATPAAPATFNPFAKPGLNSSLPTNLTINPFNQSHGANSTDVKSNPFIQPGFNASLPTNLTDNPFNKTAAPANEVNNVTATQTQARVTPPANETFNPFAKPGLNSSLPTNLTINPFNQSHGANATDVKSNPFIQPGFNASLPTNLTDNPFNKTAPASETALAYGGSCSIIKGQDLLSFDHGDHSGPSHGRMLNMGELDSIQKALTNFPNVTYFQNRADEMGSFCNNAPADRKLNGGYMVMATAIKLFLMPVSKWDGCDNVYTNMGNPYSCWQTAGKVYGQLKVAGMAGNGAKVRQILVSNGGSAGGLCDEMLAVLWAGNEHQFLHDNFCHPDQHQDINTFPCVDADHIFHAQHITSLSDTILAKNPYWGSLLNSAELGGFNNAGDFPQGRCFTSAKVFLTLFPAVPKPSI